MKSATFSYFSTPINIVRDLDIGPGVCRPMLGVMLVFMFSLPSIAATEFIPVRLTQKLVVDLPENWLSVADKKRVAVEYNVQNELNKYGLETIELTFSATHFEASGGLVGIFNFVKLVGSPITQANARDVSPRYADKIMRQTSTQTAEQANFQILSWIGTKKRVINGRIAFVSEYRRSPIKENGEFRVRVAYFFDGDNTFITTVSYPEDLGSLMRPISDRIIASIR